MLGSTLSLALPLANYAGSWGSADHACHMQDTSIPRGQLAAVLSLVNLSRCADLRVFIAAAALPALADMLQGSPLPECRQEAARVLAQLAYQDSLCKPVADAALQGLTALLEVRACHPHCLLWHALTAGCQGAKPVHSYLPGLLQTARYVSGRRVTLKPRRMQPARCSGWLGMGTMR